VAGAIGVVAGAISVVAGAAAQPEGVTAAHDDAPAACIEGDAGSSAVPQLGDGEDGAPSWAPS
jgi:hypothetical protein